MILKLSAGLLLFLLVPAVAEDEERPVATTAAMDPAETAGNMKMLPGFKIESIVGEPEITQPIAFTMDDRGRLWVLEGTNYPNSPGEPKDRIIVLEDADGDGAFEKKSVFWDKAHFSSGIAVGFGGVWLGSPPNLLFIPDGNDDLVPDKDPEIVLDGWGAEDTHETLNNFIWGPDGWLYGTQGVFTHSSVGRPGTPDEQRVPINGGVWRYHPTRKVFERWAEGVSNQWGLDWNDRGEAFFAACVIPHMWHGIEGAHYTRQAGAHFNPHLYEDIQSIAWGQYEKAAFCGAMIYLGDAFPAEWRDNFFFNDIHINSIRCETFERDGSGFKSQRKVDFVASQDKWFRGLSLQYGPDGGVFVSDWYDKVPCHQQAAFADRSNGRIYKIVTDRVKPRVVNLGKASDDELVKMQLEPNDWYVRHARRLLQERGPKPQTTAALEKILLDHADETRQLRALWVLHCQDALQEATALKALAAKSEFVRGWTVTCLTEQGLPSAPLLARLLAMATEDPSPIVRRRLASAAQKFPLTDRWPLLTALAAHEGDIGDRNIPLMNWYAAEPAVAADPVRGVELLRSSPQPKLHEYIARRVLSAALENPAKNGEAMDALTVLLSESDSAKRESILRGLLAAARGQKILLEPKGWPAVDAKLRTDPSEEVQGQARTLSVFFGSATGLAELRELLTEADAPVPSRLAALEALASRRDTVSLKPLMMLASTAGPLRIAAIRSLAGYGDPQTAPAIIASYSTMSAEEKRAALNTLAARLETAKELIVAIDSGKIPRKDVGASLARLIQALQQPEFDEWLVKNFGTLNPSSAEREAEIEKYKKFLGTDAILQADAKNGRAIYERTCSACHEIFGEGGHIGPELPGNFTDIDYLLGNILAPNAEIGRDFQQTFVTTKSGNLVAGVVVNENAKSLTLKTLGESVTIAVDDIAKRELSPLSMMPEGLLAPLQEQEVRDLFLFLRQSNYK